MITVATGGRSSVADDSVLGFAVNCKLYGCCTLVDDMSLANSANVLAQSIVDVDIGRVPATDSIANCHDCCGNCAVGKNGRLTGVTCMNVSRVSAFLVTGLGGKRR